MIQDWTSDRASAPVEIVLLMPVIFLVVVFTVALGRLVGVRSEIGYAARAGARAAAAFNGGDATAEAERAIRAALADRHVSCSALVIDVDTSAFAPGGHVAVTVKCDVALSDVALLPLPGRSHQQATAVEVVDQIRGSAV